MATFAPSTPRGTDAPPLASIASVLRGPLLAQPPDAAYLADGTLSDRWYMWNFGLLGRLAAQFFRRRMRSQHAGLE